MTEQDRGFRDLGDTVILYARDYINDIEGEELEEMCEGFLNSGVKRIILDFSNTDLINSIGVSILISIIERVKNCNAVVSFSGLKKVNYDILKLVGLTEHVSVYDSEEDAISGSEDPGGSVTA
ncbi:MAG: STAS domain-containing protein [Thermodesulfobacteriota bacterium]